MIKSYVKMILMYGLTFGVLMSLWDFVSGKSFDLIKLIIMTLFFGGFMTWNTVKRMKRLKEKNGESTLTDKDFKAEQSEVITSNKTIHEIYNLLRSDKIIEKWNLILEEEEIIGKAKGSFLSFGEKIYLKVSKGEIEVTSKPALPTVFFDNGKNKQNVLLIKALINDK